jgi:hypothetical protein
MNKTKLVFVVCSLTIAKLWADCTFNITNYSDVAVTVQAGYYGGGSDTATVPIASAKDIKIKNALNCNALSSIGFGVTYVNLVGKQSTGGWVYAPAAKMIRAIGPSAGSKDMVVGTAPNGEKLVLFNNTSPNSDSFDVRIEKANRNISRQFGSMN